jgi:hypothetical protein
MDDDVKRRVQVAIIAFGVVIMVYQFFWNWGADFDAFGLFFKAIPLAFLCAAIVFFAMTVIDSKQGGGRR